MPDGAYSGTIGWNIESSTLASRLGPENASCLMTMWLAEFDAAGFNDGKRIVASRGIRSLAPWIGADDVRLTKAFVDHLQHDGRTLYEIREADRYPTFLEAIQNTADCANKGVQTALCEWVVRGVELAPSSHNLTLHSALNTASIRGQMKDAAIRMFGDLATKIRLSPHWKGEEQPYRAAKPQPAALILS